MWLQQLELRTLEVVERVQRRGQAEDDLVELKRGWPPPAKAARRIAGHANAARGEPILWLIGLDEATGFVHGVQQQEMADWWAQVQSHFDQAVAPELQHVLVQVDGGQVAALHFDTTRAPYVFRTASEPYSREVPWRDGTRIRSARRSELIKSVVPSAMTPSATTVHLRVRATHKEATPGSDAYGEPPGEEHISFHLYGKIYFDPPTSSVVLPDYAMSGRLDLNPRGTRKQATPVLELSGVRLAGLNWRLQVGR